MIHVIKMIRMIFKSRQSCKSYKSQFRQWGSGRMREGSELKGKFFKETPIKQAA
jgi:protein gp37